MSIIITDFDYQFFIKQQFILNLAIGIVGFLVAITLSVNLFTYFIYLFYFVYFLLVIYFFLKFKKGKNVILYSRHRVIGHYFLGSVFVVLALGFLSEGGFYYLTFGFIILFLLIFLVVFLNRSVDEDKYFNVLRNKFEDNENHSLSSFYDEIDRYKNKKSNFSVVLTLIVSQLVMISVLNKLFLIPLKYEILIMVAIFFIIAGYIFNKIKLYLIVPLKFLERNLKK